MKYFGIFAAFVFGFTAFAQSEINQIDDKGKKHGVWKGVYTESKRPRYEGTFDHGKEVGTFTFFDDTKAKSVIAIREFAKDNSCYTTFYNQKKNKVSEGKEVNRKYEGEWKYYHENLSLLMMVENYKNGKLDGKRTIYYRGSGTGNQPIAEESTYVNGLREGKYRKYTEKGDILEDSNYKNGALDGPAIFKDPLGNVTAKGTFTNGKKTGKWQYFNDGKPAKGPKTDIIKKKKEVRPLLQPE